jgi:hypothetical protein
MGQKSGPVKEPASASKVDADEKHNWLIATRRLIIRRNAVRVLLLD